jgi:hypothetical protein
MPVAVTYLTLSVSAHLPCPIGDRMAQLLTYLRREKTRDRPRGHAPMEEQGMPLKAKEKRSRFWPGMFTVLGTINLFDYFYKSSFRPDDVLQGIGFLLVVPLAYVQSESFAFRFRERQQRRWHTTLDWLAVVGFALVAIGFATEWQYR